MTPTRPPLFLLSLELPLFPLGTECGAAVKDSTSDTKRRPRDLCVSSLLHYCDGIASRGDSA